MRSTATRRAGSILTLGLFAASLALAQTPGTVSGPLAKTSGPQVLNPTASVTGQITASIDGVGTNAATGTFQIVKPAGATVNKAYLVSATQPSDGTLADGDATVNGLPVDYTVFSAPVNFGGINGFADVTALVSGLLNGAPAGTVDVPYGEVVNLEGSALAVVFNDPAKTNTSSFLVQFGTQNTAGDSFSLTLSDPFNDATQDIQMSLAISFSFQPSGQFSQIDVNGQRLTTSAGGSDDGQDANGALFTVGGTGDDPANPANPNATDEGGTRSDDELYTLDPLLTNGATTITVNTLNPSANDNILAAFFNVGGSAAIIGEGIVLGPANATNPVGTSHTVTARVQDTNGQPIAGRAVTFDIISGPNAGLPTATVNTNASGEAQYTWTSAVAGTDVVTASFVSNSGATITSNQANKTWVASTSGGCTDPLTEPSFNGQVIVDGTRRLIQINAPQGATRIEFYNMVNLVVGAPETPAGVAIPTTRVGDVFTFAAPLPTAVRFPLTPADPSNTRVSFFARVTDDCRRTVDVDPQLTVTAADAEAALTFGLGAPSPNPARDRARIAFAVPQAGDVTVAVFDALGRTVARVRDGALAAGRYTADFDTAALPAGTYVVRLEAGGQTATRLLTVVR